MKTIFLSSLIAILIFPTAVLSQSPAVMLEKDEDAAGETKSATEVNIEDNSVIIDGKLSAEDTKDVFVINQIGVYWLAVKPQSKSHSYYVSLANEMGEPVTESGSRRGNFLHKLNVTQPTYISLRADEPQDFNYLLSVTIAKPQGGDKQSLTKKHFIDERSDASSDYENAKRILLIPSPNKGDLKKLRILNGKFEQDDLQDSYAIKTKQGEHIYIAIQSRDQSANYEARLLNEDLSEIKKVTIQGNQRFELNAMPSQKVILSLENKSGPSSYQIAVVSTGFPKEGKGGKKARVKLPDDFSFFKRVEPAKSNATLIIAAVLALIAAVWFFKRKKN